MRRPKHARSRRLAAAPYVSSYVASKFALRGFAECLRDELRGDGIEVSTVMPASIDTPLFQHAANFTGRAAKPLRPILRPERVAGAIVRRAKRPRREMVVGASGRQLLLMHALAPALFERFMTRNVEREHFRDERIEPTEGNLRRPMTEWTGVTGGWKEGDAAPGGAGPAPSARDAGSAAPASPAHRCDMATLTRAGRRRPGPPELVAPRGEKDISACPKDRSFRVARRG